MNAITMVKNVFEIAFCSFLGTLTMIGFPLSRYRSTIYTEYKTQLLIPYEQNEV